jgi:hypothetical protein
MPPRRLGVPIERPAQRRSTVGSHDFISRAAAMRSPVNSPLSSRPTKWSGIIHEVGVVLD